MEKLKQYFYKTILILLFILVAYVSYCSIFNIYKPAEDLKPIVIIIGIIVLISIFLNLRKLFNKINPKKANMIAIIICTIFFVMLVIFGAKVTSIPTYDLSNLQQQASLMLNNGKDFTTNNYFSVYSSNIPVTILIYYIYKIGVFIGFSNLRLFATIINSLFIAITAFLTYLSVKKLEDYKIGLTTLVFFVINPAFYVYSSYFYTDTLCLPFAAGAIYLFIQAMQTNKMSSKSISFILAGILLALGFKIRVVIGILLIGMIIVLCLKDKLKLKTILNISYLICGFILGIVVYTLISLPFNTKVNSNLEFPVTHWVMMGVNDETDGRWNLEDYMYTYNNSTYEKKVDANIIKIKERLNDLGVKGCIDFAKTKLAVNWSNGNYDYIAKLVNTEEINDLYAYVSGNKKIFLLYLCQICKATVLITFLFAVFNEYTQSSKKYAMIFISMFGAFIFYLLWEVLTRYSLTFLPWMMIVFGIGIKQIENIIKVNEIKFKHIDGSEKTFKCRKIKKITVTMTIILTISLLAINYYEYTERKSLKWDLRAIQCDQAGNYVSKISNKKIEQTFKASKEYNCISIKFKKENITSETNYEFMLKDNNGKELVKQHFTSTNVENEVLKTFYFDEIKPKNNQEYIIEISSIDATDNNSLGIASFYQKGYTAFEEGKLIINDEVIKYADLTFQVQKEVIRPYTSKGFYILLCSIIISIEVFAFYPLIIKERRINKNE